jgi:hypothetical protein
MNYLPILASNCDPPDLSLPSSEDYSSKPPAPGSDQEFYTKFTSYSLLRVTIDQKN